MHVQFRSIVLRIYPKRYDKKSPFLAIILLKEILENLRFIEKAFKLASNCDMCDIQSESLWV